MTKKIEVEIRSIISPNQFKRLEEYFKERGKFIEKNYEETVHFSGPKDLRIRRDDHKAYLILKEGKMHDNAREELEVLVPKKDFGVLERIFISLGFEITSRWKRSRIVYKWKGIKVHLGITRGYGRIIEFEKVVSESKKEETYKKMRRAFESLKIKVTPRKEFEVKYNRYLQQWRNILSG